MVRGWWKVELVENSFNKRTYRRLLEIKIIAVFGSHALDGVNERSQIVERHAVSTLQPPDPHKSESRQPLTWFMTCDVKSRNMDLTHSSPSMVADMTFDMNTESNLLASFLSSALSSGASFSVDGGGAELFLLCRASSFAFSSGVKQLPLPSGRF